MTNENDVRLIDGEAQKATLRLSEAWLEVKAITFVVSAATRSVVHWSACADK